MSRERLFDLSRYLVVALVLGAIVALMVPIPGVSADEVVTFADANLQAAIREAVGKPAGDVYQSDLDSLTSLYAYGLGIVDLSGLEHCTSLIHLNLSGNQISDVSPVSGLTGLTSLDLSINQISLLSGLSSLSSLMDLYLGYNQVDDLSPLSGLTGLRCLGLTNNQISDLSPLAGLTGLGELRLEGNQISDVSPLSGLTSLTAELALSENQIVDISPLSGLTVLKELYLDGNLIGDLSPLSGLTGLTSLDLGSNQISNLSGLSVLSSLTDLYLGNNQISDLSPLSILTDLRGLDLHSNEIAEVAPIGSLTSLTYLDLSANQIDDFSPLSGLTGLMDLALRSNQVSDISPLAGLTSLMDLDLGYNQISDLSPLSGLAGLTSLVLRNNHISDLSGLSGLGGLTNLVLRDNQISDITPLAGLTSLTDLILRNNQISDIEPLVDNPGIAMGDAVDLRGNPLSGDSVRTYIPVLQARGVGVASDALPPSVATGNASSITTSSARLSGDLISLGAARSVTVSFVWGASSGSYPNETAGQAMTRTGTFCFDLGSLAPGTTYYYKAKAVGNGTDHGVEQSFATGQSPVVDDVDPGSGKRTQHLTVTISGANFGGATSLSFGSGIVVEHFNVNSSTEMIAEVAIDADATKGARDVSVKTVWGTGTKADGFSVVGGGGGICSGGASPTLGVASGMTTTVAALGLLFGAGYWLVRKARPAV